MTIPAATLSAILVAATGATGWQQPDARTLVREEPSLVRDSVISLLVHAAANPHHLDAAATLARLYAEEWGDSTLTLRSSTVAGLSLERRRLFARADSLRRAGNEALFAEGPVVAIDRWRSSAEAFAAVGDGTGVALVQGNVSAGFYELGLLDSAAVYAERTRRGAARAGDRRTTANAVTMLGNVALERGNLLRALSLYETAVGLHDAIGDRTGLAADYTNLGIVHGRVGDRDAAGAAYKRARDLYITAGDPVRAADLDVNLGTLDLSRGEYRSAATQFDAAGEVYEAAGELANVALVRSNQGALHARLAEYRKAERAYMDAARLYRELQIPDEEFNALRSLVAVLAATGNLDAAYATFAEAEQLATRPGLAVPRDALGDLWLTRGDLALRMNRLSEARSYYQRAGEHFLAARQATGWAESLQGRGAVAVAADAPDEARELLKDAGIGVPDNPAWAWGRLSLAMALRLSGAFDDARDVLGKLGPGLAPTGDVEAWAAVQLELGTLDRIQNYPHRAEERYRAVLDRAGTLPAIGWRARRQLALLLEDRHAYGEAAAHLEAAVAQLAAVAGKVDLDARRAAYMADKWEVYAQLARVLERTGRTDSSFAVAEALRARQLLDLLAKGRLDAIPHTLVAAEQDLRRRIAELSNDTGTWPPPTTRDAPIRQTPEEREALWHAQDAYRALLDTLASAAPAYAGLVRGETMNAADVRRALDGQTAFVEYLLSEREVLIYAVTRDTTVLVRIPAPRFAVAAQIDFVRGILSRPGDGRRIWRTPLAELHDILIRPVEAVLRGHQRLIIAPHRELHYLPFEALVTPRGRFLIEQFAVTYAPSASVWLRLAERPAPTTRGVLAVAPLTSALPGTAREVDTIMRLLPDVTSMSGQVATESWLARRAGAYRVIHLATRGVLNKHNPLFSYVETHADDTGDGHLEVHEIFGLDLEAQLVVLSACHTALGSGALADIPEGDDWVGLVRALLFAGAQNVLATLWAVDDQATAGFMARFYSGWARDEDVSQNLAAAKRQAIRNDGRFADPYYWAGFVGSGAFTPTTDTKERGE